MKAIVSVKGHLWQQIGQGDAEEDTVAILKEYEGRVKGIIHCFTGTSYLASEALKLGYNISISGVVTFKNAESLRTTVRDIVPLDRLHVETDAPFLTPTPHRGKLNSPAQIPHTLRLMAEVRGVGLEQLCEAITANTIQVYGEFN